MPRGQAGQTLAGRALYLTRDWAADDERLRCPILKPCKFAVKRVCGQDNRERLSCLGQVHAKTALDGANARHSPKIN